MAKSKSSNAFWWVLGGIIVLIGLFVFLFGGAQTTNVAYENYQYSDADVANPNATHTIIEFADFQCPACGQAHPLFKRAKAEFDVQVDFKHFPLTSIHPYAQLAAEASECARDQGMFWAYHDVLMEHQDQLAKSQLKAHAKGLGLDTDPFDSCLDKREKQTVVAADIREGSSRNVPGTPTVFIDGEQIQLSNYDDLANRLQ